MPNVTTNHAITYTNSMHSDNGGQVKSKTSRNRGRKFGILGWYLYPIQTQ